MGLFDDDFDDIYPADLYPEYDFNRDGHIDAFEATEIAAEGFEDHDISGGDDPISELEDYGMDFGSFLAMSDAEKYKFLQDAVILNEFDYLEYFDDYDRISVMDSELIELCEYGIDPYDFEDANDDHKYQMLKKAGLDSEDYELLIPYIKKLSGDEQEDVYRHTLTHCVGTFTVDEAEELRELVEEDLCFNSFSYSYIISYK